MLKTLHLTLLASVVTASIASCPGYDWKQFRDMCYWGRSDYELKCADVANVCNSIYPGAEMVTIHDLEQNTFIAQEIAGRGGDPEYTWIGLSRASSSDDWVWDDGSAVNYTQWYDDDPDHYPNGGNCALINYYSWGTWACHVCDDLREYFMCQIAAQ